MLLQTPTESAIQGVLSLLEEDDIELKYLALKKLDVLVDVHWAEISESIRKIEILYENESFEGRELAALICAKVYYHLNALDESLLFALGAGALFDVNKKGEEFVDTIIAKSIDTYIDQRVKLSKGNIQSAEIDSRLADIVGRMFDRCFQDGEYRQALGIAIESRRLDIVEKSLVGDRKQLPNMLAYALDISQNLVMEREFKQLLLKTLVKLYEETPDESKDYFGLVQCLVLLKDVSTVANILNRLLCSGKDNAQDLSSDKTDDMLLIAYQLAFDLIDRAPQSFLVNVRQELPKPVTKKIESTSEEKSTSAEATSSSESSTVEDQYNNRLENLHAILNGQLTTSLAVDFLYHHNHADMKIMQNIRGLFDRNPILHSATITANSFMYAGTTVDRFLRENLEWLKKASNWAKFSATASIGVIHKGQTKDAMTILHPYLPSEEGGNSRSPYSEGGSLYALGLIHPNLADQATIDYLVRNVNREEANPVMLHGACLGLGLTAMATGREDLYESLKNILYKDDAVAGEAAAIGAGMVMLGTANELAIEEMKTYARETAHEKIIRGLAIGLAMTMYEREDEADALIDELIQDKEHILRYGAMYTIGMAYCGTGNNNALRKLLQIAVSDVSDDVRRAAVLNLGFLLSRNPKQCPRLLSLLAESYNPHVRYGVTQAVGISCAGTGLMEAIELLEPMTNDPTDFVRQGALMALAMVVQQLNSESATNPEREMTRQLHKKEKEKQNKEKEKAQQKKQESSSSSPSSPPTTTTEEAAAAAAKTTSEAKPTTSNQNTKPRLGQKVKSVRSKIESTLSARDEVMSKMGAVLSAGIIDAGGRNVTIQLHKGGHNKMKNVVGMMVFSQYWFWHPFLHFLSLTFEPTAIIGLNSELKMPEYHFKSNIGPRFFAYPKEYAAPKKVSTKEVVAAELSVAAKAKRREARKKRGAMTDDDLQSPLTATSTTEDVFTDAIEKQSKKTKVEEAEEEEPLFEMLQNPARVLPAQMRYLRFDVDNGYEPLEFSRHGGLETGIVILKNLKPDEPEKIVHLKTTKSTNLTDDVEDLDALIPDEIPLSGLEFEFPPSPTE